MSCICSHSNDVIMLVMAAFGSIVLTSITMMMFSGIIEEVTTWCFREIRVASLGDWAALSRLGRRSKGEEVLNAADEILRCYNLESNHCHSQQLVAKSVFLKTEFKCIPRCRRRR